MEIMYGRKNHYLELITERIMIKIHSCLLKNVYINLFPLYHFFL